MSKNIHTSKTAAASHGSPNPAAHSSSSSATPGKDTIYIDVDDEITSIIEKVKASPQKIIAVVLPKRATVLQSIVNMKLLKRGADSAHKKLVLITSESGLFPLAGVVGLHVAKNLQSKPQIPAMPNRGNNPDGDDELYSDESNRVRAEAMSPAAAAASGLAAGSVVGGAAGQSGLNDLDAADSLALNAPRLRNDRDSFAGPDDTETIELDNIDLDPSNPAETVAKGKASKKNSKGLKIPNFERFRLGLMIGLAVLSLLIGGWYVAFVIMPKATITIKTDASAISSNITLAASENFKEVDIEARKLPAVKQQIKKTDTEKTPATGSKDIGTKATGEITVKNCEDSNPRNVAAGSVFSAAGKNFIANKDTVVPAGSFSGGGTICNSVAANAAVTAAENGDSYNLAVQSYTHSALSGKFTINGSAMGGGTSGPVAGGAFVEPTLFVGATSQMGITREEIFGPVAVVTAFDTVDQAIALANDSIYGLAASVWTRDLKQAHRMVGALEAGVVWVNCFGDGDMTQPFGGYKQSGNSRDKHMMSLMSYTQSKSAWFSLG